MNEGSQTNKKITTNSDKKMVDENSLALKVISLEKSMRTVVKALKALGATVKTLEAKMVADHEDEIKEIKKNQELVESILAENTDAIKRIDDEIQGYIHNKLDNSEDDLVNDGKIKEHGEKSPKMCRYFNRGHCKNKSECRFSHSSEVCSTYIEEGKCVGKPCQRRHPKVCKWIKTATGCRRQDCDFLHVTFAVDDGKQVEAHKSYPCMGCKNIYEDKVCVVQHTAQNKAFFLCLNCDDWILRKNEILLPGWSLFDGNGHLKQNV